MTPSNNGGLQHFFLLWLQNLEDLFSPCSPEVLNEGQEAADSLGIGQVFRLQVCSDRLPVLRQLQNTGAVQLPSFWAHSLQRELFSTTQWSPRSSHRLYEARRKYSSLLPLGAMPPQHHFVCQCWTWGTWGNSQPMFGGVGPPMTVVITTSEARLWAH